MNEKPGMRAKEIKWMLAITACAAVAVLFVFLHTLTGAAYLYSGAQLEEAPALSAEEKLQAALGLAGTQTDTAGQDAAGKININTADAQTLQTLPGIGETLAQRIIEYRSYNGPFTKPEDLMLVSGIGLAKYQKLSAWITI